MKWRHTRENKINQEKGTNGISSTKESDKIDERETSSSSSDDDDEIDVVAE